MERAFRYANHRYQNIKIGVLENLGYIRHKQIVPTGTNGRKIYVFKKESIEHVEILPIYGFISSGSFDVNVVLLEDKGETQEASSNSNQ